MIIGPLEQTMYFWRMVLDHGVCTNAVVPPAVQPNACRLRTSCIATHTRGQLDHVLDVFAKVRKRIDRMGPAAARA